MTRNRGFLTSIALVTVAGLCISTMGCGDKADGKKTTTVESTTKKVEGNGADKKPAANGVKKETKTDAKTVKKAEVKKDAKTEVKTEVKKDGEKQAPPFPAEKANNTEAGSSTVPGGGVETPQ